MFWDVLLLCWGKRNQWHIFHNPKFARASADLIFRIKKDFTSPFFSLLVFFSYATFVKKWAQMVENCSQGKTFVKGGWKFSNIFVE